MDVRSLEEGRLVRIKDDPVLTSERDSIATVLKDNGEWVYLVTNSSIRTEIRKEKLEPYGKHD